MDSLMITEIHLHYKVRSLRKIVKSNPGKISPCSSVCILRELCV